MAQTADPPPRPTLGDVARLAGVSKTTASYAYSRPGRVAASTHAKVMEAARQLNFVGPSGPGLALASGRSHVIAIITGALVDESDDVRFSLKVIDELIRELTLLEYGVLLLKPASTPQARDLLASMAYDSAVAIQRRGHFAETNDVVANRGVPLLQLDGDAQDDLVFDLQDSKAIAEIIVELQRLGHRRIATVTLPFDGSKRRSGLRPVSEMTAAKPASARARLAAFGRAGVLPSAIYECAAVKHEEGVVAGRALLGSSERPTAIVCQADALASGVVEAARALGLRVPEDVSVTGFDGLAGPDMDALRLTTVHQDAADRSRAIARWIVGAAEGAPPERVALAATVRWGKTTGPVPAPGP